MFLTQVFSYEFCEIFKSTFFIEHLEAASEKDNASLKGVNSVKPIFHKLALFSGL